MKIYKLGEIAEVIIGNNKYTEKYILKNKGKYPVISSKTTNNGVYGWINSYEYEKGITISKDGNAGKVFFQNNHFSVTSHAFFIKNNESIISKKFLFYFLLKNEMKISSLSTGSTRDGISKKSLENFLIKIPSLEIQRSIIDIIEPINKIENIINNLISKINNSIKNFSNINKFKTNVFLEKIVNFNKGDMFSENGIEKNIFINISAMNNNVNKYILNKKNVNFGDILLSLDATPGLVKNDLEGFNGYAYHLTSKIISNFEIYLNLINKWNQKIIKQNCKGTTILHCSSAKNKMIYFDYRKILFYKFIYNFWLKLKLFLKQIYLLKQKSIKLLINFN